MGRLTLWTAAVYCVLTALNRNACSTTVPPDPQPEEDTISISDVICKLSNDIKLALDSIKKYVLSAESVIRNKTNEFVIPLAKAIITPTADDIRTLTKSLYIAINNHITKIDPSNILSGSLLEGIEKLDLLNLGGFITDLERIIEEKEYELTGALMCLNLTNNPKLFNELLQALYDYPDSKDYLGTLVKKNLINIIYGKYSELSDQLKYELKNEIKKGVEIAEDYVSGVNENENSLGDDVERFVEKESENVIAAAIDAFIDKLFDDANTRSKNTLDGAINIDKSVIISIGNNGTLF